MFHTEYAYMSSNELTNYALSRDNSSNLEIELAQRLLLAMDMLEEKEEHE